MKKIKILKIELEEPEINALITLGKIDCPDLSISQCNKCPFHLDGSIKQSDGTSTSCFSILCSDILRKG